MSDLSTPDFLDINPDVQAAAMATMNRDTVLTPPPDAEKNTDKKGNDYYRWTEPSVIESAWRETTKSGLLAAVVQLKIRAGAPNGGARTWARHTLHPALLSGTAEEDVQKKYQFMNDKSIAGLVTLLKSCSYLPESGVISGKLLNMMFPIKNAPGAVSPIKGKTVFINLSNSPNKGPNAEKTPRQTQVESYLPDEGE